jgi:RNA polymerase sigma factor (TIGR02999 family)
MHSRAKPDVTDLLTDVPRDLPEPGHVAEQLLRTVYDELRGLASHYLRRERTGHTLQTTALVHEAYERLADPSRVSWQGRAHFLAAAAQAMRRILIDHARERGAIKRGGGRQRVTLNGLSDDPVGNDLDLEDLIGLDRALQKLRSLHEREARVLECRYFAGMTTREIATFLGVSERTVRGDWSHARAWLKRELFEGDRS